MIVLCLVVDYQMLVRSFFAEGCGSQIGRDSFAAHKPKGN